MRRYLLVVASLVVLLTACDPPVEIPPAGTGPGGGQFIVQCKEPVTNGSFDPIVAPGNPNGSHRHEFYGNRSINPNSDYSSLIGKPTACEHPGDTAIYWHPTLYANGVRVIAPKSTFYYDMVGDGPVRAWPKGLKMIAGNSKATAPQDTDVVNWGCGNGSGTSEVNRPPQCSGDGRLTFHIVFPDCWNGTRLDSADHKSHMAYSNDGACPSTHRYKLVRLTIRIQFTDYQPNPSSLTLSSGSVNTLHADVINSWNQARLQNTVQQCVNAGTKCSADEAARF